MIAIFDHNIIFSSNAVLDRKDESLVLQLVDKKVVLNGFDSNSDNKPIRLLRLPNSVGDNMRKIAFYVSDVTYQAFMMWV